MIHRLPNLRIARVFKKSFAWSPYQEQYSTFTKKEKNDYPYIRRSMAKRGNEYLVEIMVEIFPNREISESESYEVINNEFDQKLINIDDYTKEMNEVYLSNISEDIYIEEAFNVIKDLINSIETQ